MKLLSDVLLKGTLSVEKKIAGSKIPTGAIGLETKSATAGGLNIYPHLTTAYGVYVQAINADNSGNIPLSLAASKFIFENGNIVVGGNTDAGYRADIIGSLRAQSFRVQTSSGNAASIQIANQDGTVLSTYGTDSSANTYITGFYNLNLIPNSSGSNGSVIVGSGGYGGFLFDVNGTSRFQGDITVTNNGNLSTVNQFYGLATNFVNGIFVGYDSSATYLNYSMGSRPVHIGTNGSGDIRIKTSGNTVIENGNLTVTSGNITTGGYIVVPRDSNYGTRAFLYNSDGNALIRTVSNDQLSQVFTSFPGVSINGINIYGNYIVGTYPTGGSISTIAVTGVEPYGTGSGFVFNAAGQIRTQGDARASAFAYTGNLLSDNASQIIRGFYFNPSAISGPAIVYAFESTVGKIKVSDLSGAGTRMVVADSTGTLTTQSISTGSLQGSIDADKTDSGTLSVGTTTVKSVSASTYSGVFFDYVVKNTTNVRVGSVVAITNGSSVEYYETLSNDLGDTSAITFAVDLSGGNIRLRATTSSTGWTAIVSTRAI